MRRRWRIAVVALGAAALAACPAQATTPGENGSIVLNDADGGLYTVAPDGSGMTQIAGAAEIARWSSAGDLISVAASSGDGRVSTGLLSPDGSVFDTQAIPDPTLNAECPSWQPGDARLACEVWDDVRPERTPGIFSIRRDGWDDLTRITENTQGGHDIPGDYSPDGEWLAFAREVPGRGVANFVVPAVGGPERQVSAWLPDISAPRWSPDGRRLLYDNIRGDLVTVRPDGTGRRRVHLDVATRAFAFDATWSPDGTRIVFGLFTLHAHEGVSGIYTSGARGGAVTPVATTTENFFHAPDWGPE
jgi:Tol biopolymer transport system component